MATCKRSLPRWYQQELHPSHSQFGSSTRSSKLWLVFGAACAAIYLSARHFWHLHSSPAVSGRRHAHTGLPFKDIAPHLKRFQDCSIGNLAATNLTFLDTAAPLSVAEFVNRRDRLARALYNEGLDAFIVEPGYTFSYYANVTQPEWEVWVR